MNPADENDIPVFVGRFNLGAISLNLPMILAKARRENKDFYEVLDYYMEMIRQIHLRTYDYFGEMRASINPVVFCEGGCYGGHLKPTDKLKSILPPMTLSFGITALNELQQLYNKKSIREDGAFAIEVMEYINKKIAKYKQEDGKLYAVYGTPAESLCLAGDTVVQVYGGNKMIKDITENDLVYTFNETSKKVELKRVLYSGMTQRNAKVVRVTMDNGQTVTCTPNHPFAVRVAAVGEDGTRRSESVKWINAEDLEPGFRIKSNYIRLDPILKRHTCSIHYNGRKQLIQDINAEYAYGPKPEGYVTHHKDENKLNNLFENICYMSGADHRRHHINLTIAPYQYTSESMMGENNPFYGKRHSDETKATLREKNKGKSMICLDPNTMEIIKKFECVTDAQNAGYTMFLASNACKGIRDGDFLHPSGHMYKDMLWYYTEDYNALMEQNHRVVSVEYLDETFDVYDITVEDNHNFFVGGDQGILVHNCALQVKQFRKEFGVIENVSDKTYVSNSFHCHVSEDMTPIEKQDKEYRFWELFNGGKIQYVRYPINYNIEATKTLVRRAMAMGLYEGVNMSLSYCNDCGHEELNMDSCPKCGSRNLTKIDRMNGYLAFSRVKGDTRLNAGKMDEIADRVSM